MHKERKKLVWGGIALERWDKELVKQFGDSYTQ